MVHRLARARIYNELVELETSRTYDRSSGYISAEVWLTVLWSGDRPGDRLLVLPNEESVPVVPRVFFRSSHDSFCNFTLEIIEAGRTYPIDLGYNVSVSIRFSFNDSSVVYNVFTLETAEHYEPEDVDISLAEYWAFAQEVGFVCAGFGALFALAAIKVRSRT